MRMELGACKRDQTRQDVTVELSAESADVLT
ncbi:hypothetical protein SAMN04489841_0669 [Natrinema salaciae]|uniref:Uncharacterized protein n=1 Tax=Natrinema salaciae TaxID=1186196 RepID=A0A1H9B8I8_9EURY|nr:hypothetical protein SAMN04489841_0669 [Natrinema salaciae]